MKLQVLAGAAVLALIAGGALAATHTHKSGNKSAGAYAPPAQPIAYAKLDGYLKTAPTKRAKQDWSLGSTATASAAQTGATANTSATAPQSGAMPDTTPPAAPDAATAPPAPSAQTAPPAPSPPDQMGAPATRPASAAPPATPPASGPNGT